MKLKTVKSLTLCLALVFALLSAACTNQAGTGTDTGSDTESETMAGSESPYIIIESDNFHIPENSGWVVFDLSAKSLYAVPTMAEATHIVLIISHWEASGTKPPIIAVRDLGGLDGSGYYKFDTEDATWSSTAEWAKSDMEGADYLLVKGNGIDMFLPFHRDDENLRSISGWYHVYFSDSSSGMVIEKVDTFEEANMFLGNDGAWFTLTGLSKGHYYNWDETDLCWVEGERLDAWYVFTEEGYLVRQDEMMVAD